MFADTYKDVTRSLPVSPRLEGLLEAFYNQMSRRPANIRAIVDATRELLLFLTTLEGRTDANCKAVDFFICFCDWRNGYPDLPDWLGDIMGDMAGALHDTVSAPAIASNFESTPEQLLERLKQNAGDDASLA